MLTIIPEVDLCAGAVLTAVSRPFDVHLTSIAMKLIYSYTFDVCYIPTKYPLDKKDIDSFVHASF